ncbi:MAG TPA: AI-2E family transporter [Bacteroidota bacterium]|nr:AI-2E family transporter [Bacteroidota bacterium]
MPRRARLNPAPERTLHEAGANLPQGRSHAETVLLAAAVLLIALLAFAVYPSLSPFVILAGLLYLLYPYRQERVPRRLLWLGTFLFVVWFVSAIIGVLAPFIIALFLAYILNPLVVVMERRRVPRWLSTLIIMILLVGALVTLGLFVVPVALEQFQALTAAAGTLAGDASRAIESGALVEILGRFGVSGEKAREVFTQNLTPKLEEMITRLFAGLADIVSSVSALAHQLLNIIIVPFVLFYLLLDFPLVLHRGAMLVPKKSRSRVIQLASRADDLMGSYFRGAILVASIQGTISGFVLWVAGVQYAVVLGLMTAALDFVPYVGLAVSLVVASTVALFSGGAVGTKVLVVVVMYLSQKVFEAAVLGPKILGKHVGLHPVLLILSLLVFGEFLGLVGLLIAVPATALLIAGIKEWETARKSAAAGGGG